VKKIDLRVVLLTTLLAMVMSATLRKLAPSVPGLRALAAFL
jgi:hypothetical protein